MSEQEEILNKLYYNPSHPAGFSSVQKLHFYANKENIVSKKEVEEWLMKQNTYTLHKPRVKNFNRSKYIVKNINEQFQADLVDMQKFANTNQGYKYILTVIDLFSKFSFAVPLKSKSSKEVLEAFKQIFQKRKPFKIQTDKGKEFLNKDVSSFFKNNDVHFFTSQNETIKCSLVERFNRTLKSKMWKYFTANGTTKWINILDEIVDSYNNSVHRTIKMKPVDVSEENEKVVFKNIYGFNSLRELLKSSSKPVKLNVDDSVRIPYTLKNFEKSYYPLWQDQVFKVHKIQKYFPRKTIKVKDQQGNILPKRFNLQEIQKIKEDFYRIEKILKTRKRKGKIEYFVKWLGYPDSYNSWEPSENLKKLNG